MDTKQNKNLHIPRQSELVFSNDGSVPCADEKRLETNTSGDTARADDMPIQEGQQVHRDLGYIEHLADAICRYLDWRDYVHAQRAIRKQHAMLARRKNRRKDQVHALPDDIVATIPQVERFRRFLADSRGSVYASVATQVHDAQSTDRLP